MAGVGKKEGRGGGEVQFPLERDPLVLKVVVVALLGKEFPGGFQQARPGGGLCWSVRNPSPQSGPVRRGHPWAGP